MFSGIEMYCKGCLSRHYIILISRTFHVTFSYFMASSSHFPRQSKDAMGEDKRAVPHPEARRTLPNLPGPLFHGIFCSAGHAACVLRRWQRCSRAFWESLNAESGEASEHVKKHCFCLKYGKQALISCLCEIHRQHKLLGYVSKQKRIHSGRCC